MMMMILVMDESSYDGRRAVGGRSRQPTNKSGAGRKPNKVEWSRWMWLRWCDRTLSFFTWFLILECPIVPLLVIGIKSLINCFQSYPFLSLHHVHVGLSNPSRGRRRRASQNRRYSYSELSPSPLLFPFVRVAGISGCTTRKCRVRASFRLNVFSSVQYLHRSFCFPALWIVSSCRVRSYGREKMVLQGLFVDGLIRSHLWGPLWLFNFCAIDVIPPRFSPPMLLIKDVEFRWTSRLCFWSLGGVSNLLVHPWYVHVYVPLSADVLLGLWISWSGE